jgi:glycosyltransferase involved in cell wall biosynthesis
MGRPRLAIVIPCHNEATTLAEVVRGAAAHGDVFVVDDRSQDQSVALARAAGAQVLTSAAPGYDGAIETGLRHAYAHDYAQVITLDADGEHDPALILSFKAAMDNGAPLVCGYRPRPQRAAEYVVGAYGLFVLGVRDLLCGMKGYSREVIGDYLTSEAPLLVNMAPVVIWRKAGGGYVERPVTGRPRVDQPRFGRRWQANLAILSALKDVMRL